MAQHKFEGLTEHITEGQLEFIKNVIEKEGFKDSKITFEAVGGPADNYGANVKRIVIEGENGNLNMIAKIAPSFELFRKGSGVDVMFNNEHLMYTEVLPKFLSLQKRAEVPEEDLLKFPKCYGTNLEKPNEVILLEDLKASGFCMVDRVKSLTNEHITSVLKNLAIFHSLSYVLRNKEPETYDYFKNNLRDLLGTMTETPEVLGFFQQIETVSLHVLEDPEHKNIVTNKINEFVHSVSKMTKFENGSRYAVIQHGDCWTNNIMFKFEKSKILSPVDVVKFLKEAPDNQHLVTKGENVEQAMLIDYQQSKNFSPVYDILYLIFNCTDHETRIQNFYNWLDHYHLELDKSLSNFGLKASYVYPKDQLDADLKRYGRLAFGCATLMSGTLTINPEEAGKLKEAMESGKIENMVDAMGSLHDDTLSLLKKRIIGLVESFKAFGLL